MDLMRFLHSVVTETPKTSSPLIPTIPIISNSDDVSTSNDPKTMQRKVSELNLLDFLKNSPRGTIGRRSATSIAVTEKLSRERLGYIC